MAINQRRSSGTATLTGARMQTAARCSILLFVIFFYLKYRCQSQKDSIIWVIMCSTALLNKHNKTYVSQENNKHVNDNK